MTARRNQGASRAALATVTAIVYCVQLFSSCVPPAKLKVPVAYRAIAPDVQDGTVVAETAFNYSVSNDGAAVVNIPLVIPPGRLGMQPQLGLSYSSQGGNGPLGIGWSISGLSSISACRESVATHGALGGANPKGLCLDGQRLVPVAPPGSDEFNAAEFRTEIDSYRKITVTRDSPQNQNEPLSFTVYEPTGLIRYYGLRHDVSPSSNSRLRGTLTQCMYGQGSTTCTDRDEVTRVWMLDSVKDRFDNEIQYDYEAGNGMLLKQVRYTSNGMAAAAKRVDFSYTTGRSDARTVRVGGIRHGIDRLLTSIEVTGPLGLSHSSYVNDTGVLTRYRLSYDQNATTRQSQLQTVTECSIVATKEFCKPPLTFAYTGTSHTYEDRLIFDRLRGGPTFPFASGDSLMAADLNGDGREDLLYRPAGAAGVWKYRLNQGGQLGPEQDLGVNGELAASFAMMLGLVDLNGDHAVDAIAPDPAGFKLIAGKSSGMLGPPSSVAGVLGPGPEGLAVAAIADIDGDSKADIIADQNCVVLPGTQDRWCTRVYALNTSTGNSISFDTAARLLPPNTNESSTCPGYATTCNPNKCQGFQCRPPQCINSNFNPEIGETETDCGGQCIPCGPVGPFVRKGAPAYVADVDGNGAADILTPVWDGGTGHGEVLSVRSRSTKPALNSTAIAVTTWSSALPANVPARFFLDVNGDGLSDSVSFENGSAMLSLNAGGTFEAAVATAPTLTLPTTWANEVRVGDFNDDGLQDLYFVSSNTFLRATGSGLAVDSLPVPIGLDSGASSDTRRKWDHWIDFNGDGLKDLIQMNSDGVHVWQRKGPIPGRLSSVSGGPLTAQVKFEYLPSSEIHTPATTSCSFPLHCLRNGMWFVARLSAEADTTEPDRFNHVSFSYAGGRFDVRGRGWLGFEGRTLTNEVTRTVVRTKFDNVTNAPASGTPSYLYPKARRPVEETIEFDDRPAADSSGKKRRVTTEYRYRYAFGAGQYANVMTVVLSEVKYQEDEADVVVTSRNPLVTAYTYSPLRARHDLFVTSEFGLLTRHETKSFEGGFDSGGGIPPSAAVKRAVLERTPFADPSTWLVQQFTRVLRTSTEPARTNRPEQTATREATVSWAAGKNAIESITVEPNENLQMPPAAPWLRSTTTFTRNPADKGNVSEVKFAGAGLVDRITTIEWDSLDQTFQSKVTNAEGHEETLYFHAGLGALVARDDANDLRTLIQIDALGRTKNALPPTGDELTVTYARTADGLLKVTQARQSGGTTTVLLNKWGNTRRTEWTAFDGRIAAIDRTYTRLGKLATETVPFFGRTTSTRTAYGYDRSGRLISLTFPEGDSEQFEYDRRVTRFTNTRGVTSELAVDALGRTIRSSTIETMAHSVATRYEYGPFDVLQAVVDPLGHRSEYDHDKLGRLRTMTEPDVGTTNLTFNSAGELVGMTTASGYGQTRTLDKLGRPTTVETRKLPGGTPEPERFTWDTATTGKGRLQSAASPSGDLTTYGYGSTGQINHVEFRVAGTPYLVDIQHDGFARPSVLTLPGAPLHGRPSVRFDYNGGGYLYKATRTAHLSPRGFNIPEVLLWSARDVDATGMVLSEQYGGTSLASFINQPPSIVTTRIPDSQGRLRRQYTVAGSTTVQDLVYEYGAGGLIKSKHDRVTSTTEDFDYDFLSRLKKWTVYQNCWKSELQYDYDDIGNLTQRIRVGMGNPIVNRYGETTNAGPHALTSSTEGSTTSKYSYEPGGRQVTAPGRTVTYNYFDLPKSISGAGATIEYKYDAFHRRTQRTRSTGGATYYAGNLFEHHTNGTANRYVYHLGIGDLEIDETQGSVGESYAFFHRDLLGTPDTVTGRNGAVLERMKFEPFGQRRYPTDLPYPVMLPSQRSTGFTGHEPDEDYGLINMGGRMYDPQTGRFLTPDPFVQAPLSSQSFNRYSYVFNNPINTVDPSGFQSIGISGSYSGGGGGGYGAAYNSELFYFSSANNPSGLGPSQMVPVAQDSTGSGQAASAVGPQAGAGAGTPSTGLERTALAVAELGWTMGWFPQVSGEELAGISYGVAQGLTPFGFLAPSPRPNSHDFQVGNAIGQGTVGAGQILYGLQGAFAGIGTGMAGLFGSWHSRGASLSAIGLAVEMATSSAAIGTWGIANLASAVNVFSTAEGSGGDGDGQAAKGAGTAFKDFNQARNAALEWLEARGFKAEQATIGKFGDNAGKPIGMKTADGRVGFRVEYDARSGAHINVWAGKEKGPHFTFEGDQSMVNQIVKQFAK